MKKTLVELANAAMKKAAENVRGLHKQSGHPLVIWQDGRVVFQSFKTDTMTKAVQQTVVRDISHQREQIATLREELEDLNDYLDATEARVRDEGKPRLTQAEVKKRYGVK